MPAYATTIRRAPRTLTEAEQGRLLKVTGEHRAGFRDHLIFAVALGTGLREHEIAALNVGDVVHDDGRVGRRLVLRVFKRATNDPAPQEVFVPDSLWYKLAKFVSWKRARRRPGGRRAPLCLAVRRAHRHTDPAAPLRGLAAARWIRPAVQLPLAPAYLSAERLPRHSGHQARPAARAAQEHRYEHDLRRAERRGVAAGGPRASMLIASKSPGAASSIPAHRNGQK